MKYKCPLCGSTLTEGHFHRVIKLQEKKEKVQKGEVEKLRKQAATATAAALAAKRKEQETRAKAQQKVDAAKKEAALAERRKTAIRDKRLMARIKKLEEEKKMLQKHTSPQEIGLADEPVLVRKLRKEFPDDQIEHAGKGGDVLHYVTFDEEKAGCIVYECKHTDRIASDHVAQTALAKKTRHADYGILVTTGTRAASHGRREAPRRVVRGRRGLAGEAASPSRRQASVGERACPRRRGPLDRRAAAAVPQPEAKAQSLRRVPKGARETGKSRRAILRAGAH